jgi:hypothetical protein
MRTGLGLALMPVFTSLAQAVSVQERPQQSPNQSPYALEEQAAKAYDNKQYAESVRLFDMVTLNYRVGPLGFLVHPDLTRESEHHSSGNYGRLDQIAALQWVQKNTRDSSGKSPQKLPVPVSAGQLRNLKESKII